MLIICIIYVYVYCVEFYVVDNVWNNGFVWPEDGAIEISHPSMSNMGGLVSIISIGTSTMSRLF